MCCWEHLKTDDVKLQMSERKSLVGAGFVILALIVLCGVWLLRPFAASRPRIAPVATAPQPCVVDKPLPIATFSQLSAMDQRLDKAGFQSCCFHDGLKINAHKWLGKHRNAQISISVDVSHSPDRVEVGLNVRAPTHVEAEEAALWCSRLVGESQPNADPAFPFRLTVSTEKRAYLIGEPVSLAFVVENTTSNLIEVTHPLDRGEYKEEIAVGLKGVEFYRVPGLEEARDALVDRIGAFPKRRWQPGGKLTQKETLLCWRLSISRHEHGELIFPKPGQYVIRCRVRWKDGSAVDEVSISVAGPSRSVDLDALAWLRSVDFLCSLQDLPYRTDPMHDPGRRPETLLRKYPASVYAVFVRKLIEPMPTPDRSSLR
jgi:hypothetical protein